VWKKQKARVFGNIRRQLTTDQLVNTVEEECRLWELARTGGSTTVARE
jgi:hypothetical protein